jgi:chorismate mutase
VTDSRPDVPPDPDDGAPWRALIRALPTPDANAAASPEALRPWRDRIDALDEAILALLNERARCATEIGHLKRALGVSVYAPEREDEVLHHVLDANAGPLPPDAVRRLFERIIDETRNLERRLTSDSPPDLP